MWFKNLAVYRLSRDWAPDPAKLEEQLARRVLQPCGSLDKESRGWVSPSGDERLLRVLNGQILIALGVEQRLLPTTIINQFAKDRARQIEEEQGRRVGRKELREIKEQVTDELLPRAFVRRRTTYAWIDPVNGWLVVDAAAKAKVEELIELLNKTLDELPASLVHSQRSPAAAMTEWLASDEAPAGFSVDRDLELRAADEGKATVRYVRHALEGEEIRGHIAAGKSATRLGLTWADRISFVLTEQLQIKRVAFLDLLKEQAERGDNAEEQFDLDFVLMSGELAKLLADLLAALGGEKTAA
jgi:recombination associated protein RdgC